MAKPQAADPIVEVYWRPGCPYCSMLMQPVRRSGLRLREVNIWEDREAAARVRSVADGSETVPTVFVDNCAMVNVNPSLQQVLAAVRGEPQQTPWWTRWTRR